MGAEELGVAGEIIRAMELRVKPCKGCESCTMLIPRGKEPVCAIKDDDVPWILEKVLLEDAGFIVAFPLYHLRANAYFECIHERMLPSCSSTPRSEKRTRWAPLGLSLSAPPAGDLL
jgi:multimeric flavodoxin WrbA